MRGGSGRQRVSVIQRGGAEQAGGRRCVSEMWCGSRHGKMEMVWRRGGGVGVDDEPHSCGSGAMAWTLAGAREATDARVSLWCSCCMPFLSLLQPASPHPNPSVQSLTLSQTHPHDSKRSPYVTRTTSSTPCQTPARSSFPALWRPYAAASCGLPSSSSRCVLHGTFMATVAGVAPWRAPWSCKGRLQVIYISAARVEAAWSCGGSVDLFP